MSSLFFDNHTYSTVVRFVLFGARARICTMGAKLMAIRMALHSLIVAFVFALYGCAQRCEARVNNRVNYYRAQMVGFPWGLIGFKDLAGARSLVFRTASEQYFAIINVVFVRIRD